LPKNIFQFFTGIIDIDLQGLKWTKNVRRGDDAWAYSQFKVSDLFKLAWKDDEANASKPEKGDLILLRQKGYVTHLVRVLDYKPEREVGKGDYNIYRIVEVLWTIDFGNPPVSAKADVMFGYSEVLDYRSGNVMELESLPIFRQRWDDNGSLGGFQTYIQNLLALSSDG
jgi:hypothetical protein